MLPQKCGSSLNDTRGARRAEVEEKGREGRTVPVTSNGALHFSRLPAFFVMMHWTERSKEQGMKSMSCAAIGGEGKFVMHLRAAGELGGRMYLSSRATAMS